LEPDARIGVRDRRFEPGATLRGEIRGVRIPEFADESPHREVPKAILLHLVDV
jgi:hypothetical protein